MQGTRTPSTWTPLVLAILLVLLSTPLHADCSSSGQEVSLDALVEHMLQGRPRYAFIGESHGIGPVKRFAVDFANALVDQGVEVGVYVEGFRTDCDPRDEGCPSLARTFNRDAFLSLLDLCRAPVHPIDPPTPEGRTAAMAATIAAGGEGLKIVLVGRSHVVHAGDPDAVHRVFGGAMEYPDPGDLAEAFPKHEIVTFDLQADDDQVDSYLVRSGGCGADFVVATAPIGRY